MNETYLIAEDYLSEMNVDDIKKTFGDVEVDEIAARVVSEAKSRGFLLDEDDIVNYLLSF